MKVNQTELLNGSVFLIFGAWIWWQTTAFPNLDEGYPGPALFPRLICLGFAFVGIVLLIRAFRRKEASSPWKTDRSGLLRLGSGIAAVALYPLLQGILTFAPALGIVCFGIALLLGVRIWVAGLTASLTVLFIFFTFKQLLNVAL